MRARGGLVVGVALGLLALMGLLAWQRGMDRPAAIAAPGPVLPGLQARLPEINGFEIRGAGDKSLVTLAKGEAGWTVAERKHWPANEGLLSRLQFTLARARLIEAKTERPELHARLGVEDVGGDTASGVELRFLGGGEPLRLVVGDEHPRLGGSYVRRVGENRAWLADQALSVERDPSAWLDRRLLDLPLARLERVEFLPAKGRAFHLSRVDDRFSLDGLPPSAMADPDRGNASAGFTDQLLFDDVADDQGDAAVHSVRFIGLDGREVAVQAWRRESRTWMRCRVTLDEGRARAWLAQGDASRQDAGLSGLQSQVAEASRRCQGHVFLLPAHKAEVLMRQRENFLAD